MKYIAIIIIIKYNGFTFPSSPSIQLGKVEGGPPFVPAAADAADAADAAGAESPPPAGLFTNSSPF